MVVTRYIILCTIAFISCKSPVRESLTSNTIDVEVINNYSESVIKFRNNKIVYFEDSIDVGSSFEVEKCYLNEDTLLDVVVKCFGNIHYNYLYLLEKDRVVRINDIAKGVFGSLENTGYFYTYYIQNDIMKSFLYHVVNSNLVMVSNLTIENDRITIEDDKGTTRVLNEDLLVNFSEDKLGEFWGLEVR